MTRGIGHVTVVGLGLIGSSIARAVKERLPQVAVTGHDASAAVRAEARDLGLCDRIADDAAEAVAAADLVILAVPVGRMADAARAIAPGLKADAVISDVGSSKAGVGEALRAALPDHAVIPAHPVAGTENSGPAAGFASLFDGRWCIVTPGPEAPADAVAAVTAFWRTLGATVETMDAAHHDMVLAVTSHLPHLIAYTIVGTASELEEVTESEVIKYSAGGFRDFTRIAASSPEMWRDIALANREALLEEIDRYGARVAVFRELVARGDGPGLQRLMTEARNARRAWPGGRRSQADE